MSVISFVHEVSVIYISTPRYGWLETVVIGTPSSEYEYRLGLVLCVIRRWTHLDMLNSICYLSDHVNGLIRSDWKILQSVSDVILQYMMLSSVKHHMG